MGFLKKVGKALKKAAPIILPIAGYALGGALGGKLGSVAAGKIAGSVVGGLLPGLINKKGGGGGDGGDGPPTGELDQVVGADGKPLTMPTVNSAAIEEARRKALLRRTQAGGRRATILADKDY